MRRGASHARGQDASRIYHAGYKHPREVEHSALRPAEIGDPVLAEAGGGRALNGGRRTRRYEDRRKPL